MRNKKYYILLANVICLICGLFFSSLSFAVDVHKDRRLKMYNMNTKEYLDVTYWSRGQYDKRGYIKIARFLRDHRKNQAYPIDLRLINLLWVINDQATRGRGFIKIYSGFRSAETNAGLRKRGYHAARNSMHIKGKAIDFGIFGVTTEQLVRLAYALKAGGVGYYRGQGFIHIDTGNVRFWKY